MKLKNHLNRLLFERGIAEGELASVCRLDQGHLNRIKNGRVQPSLVTALRIARGLGLPVNRVFYLDGTEAFESSSPGRRPSARASHGEGAAPAAESSRRARG